MGYSIEILTQATKRELFSPKKQGQVWYKWSVMYTEVKIGTNKPPFTPGNSHLSLSRVWSYHAVDLTMDLYECIELQQGSRINLIHWLQQRSLLANRLWYN